MTRNFNQDSKTARVRSLFATALVLACALGSVSYAAAQSVKPPDTPTTITPEEGNVAFLVGHAIGSQGYTCLPTATGGTSWTVTPARPEATLFTNLFGQPVQIITHFASVITSPNDFGKPVSLGGNATWQSSMDTSKVWAKAVGVLPASADEPSCSHEGSIPCLLLKSAGNEKGPTGGRLLSNVTFVQRLNTNGGAAPTTSCTVGQTQLQPYTADYFFYRKAR